MCHRSVAPCGACPPVWGIKLRVANCRLPGHERRFRKQWPSCRGPPVANGCDYVFMWTELAASCTNCASLRFPTHPPLRCPPHRRVPRASEVQSAPAMWGVWWNGIVKWGGGEGGSWLSVGQRSRSSRSRRSRLRQMDAIRPVRPLPPPPMLLSAHFHQLPRSERRGADFQICPFFFFDLVHPPPPTPLPASPPRPSSLTSLFFLLLPPPPPSSRPHSSALPLLSFVRRVVGRGAVCVTLSSLSFGSFRASEETLV